MHSAPGAYSLYISIQIKKPLLRDYLRHICNISEGDIHLITRRNDFGKFLCSMVRESDKPVRVIEGPEKVTFKLPNTDSLKLSRNAFAYIYVTDWLKIEDYLNSVFALDFDRYYLDGRLQGYKQKEIIEAFIVSRQLRLFDNETLKKRKYRQEIKHYQSLITQLVDRAKNRHKRIHNQFEPFLVT